MPGGSRDKIRASEFVVCAPGHTKKRQKRPFFVKKSGSEIKREGQGSDERKKSDREARGRRKTFLWVLQFAAVENFAVVCEILPEQLAVFQNEIGMGAVFLWQRNGTAVGV